MTGKTMTDEEMYGFVAEVYARSSGTTDSGEFETGVAAALISLGYDEAWVTGQLQPTMYGYVS